MDKGYNTREPSNLLTHKVDHTTKVREDISVLAQAEAAIGKAHLRTWRTASPITHVTKDSPPTLILHGTADKTVNIEQSIELADKLKANKVVYRYIPVKGAHHAFA